MMQIRCQRCGWNFTLGRETIGLSVAEAKVDNLEYYQFVCPNCRHEVKVQVEVLRRHLPLDYVLPIPQPKPEAVAVQKEAAKQPVMPEAKPAKPAKSIEPVKAAKPAAKKPAAKKSTDKKPIDRKLAATKTVAKKAAVASAKKSASKKSKK